MKKITLWATAAILCVSMYSCIEKDVDQATNDTKNTDCNTNGNGVSITINPWTDSIVYGEFEL